MSCIPSPTEKRDAAVVASPHQNSTWWKPCIANRSDMGLCRLKFLCPTSLWRFGALGSSAIACVVSRALARAFRCGEVIRRRWTTARRVIENGTPEISRNEPDRGPVSRRCENHARTKKKIGRIPRASRPPPPHFPSRWQTSTSRALDGRRAQDWPVRSLREHVRFPMESLSLPEDVKSQLERFEAAVSSVETGLAPPGAGPPRARGGAHAARARQGARLHGKRREHAVQHVPQGGWARPRGPRGQARARARRAVPHEAGQGDGGGAPRRRQSRRARGGRCRRGPMVERALGAGRDEPNGASEGEEEPKRTERKRKSEAGGKGSEKKKKR